MQKQAVWTSVDFLVWAQAPEQTGRLWELLNGEVHEKMPTERHSLIAGNIYAALRAWAKAKQAGRVVFEARFISLSDPANARIPDVAFTRTERLAPVVEQGAVNILPDVCVEVQSPNDTPRTLREKAAWYLAQGVQEVWLVYPAKRLLEVLTPDGDFTLYPESSTLRSVQLAGFELPISAIFED